MAEVEEEAKPLPPIRPLLVYDDPWQTRTRSTTFEGVVKPGEIVSLNHIRDMTGQRNIACVREQAKQSCSPDQVQWFKKYLSNLAYLIDQEGNRDDLEFEWTSPLSGRSNRFFRLQGLKKEQAMATYLFAALLRQLAAQTLDDLLGLSPSSEALEGDKRAAATAEAASWLRQAAGVYRYLAEHVLPPLMPELRGERPCELHAPTCEVLSLLCCAEAQALTAFRSEERGSSATLVAALHRGSAELYEKAAKGLREASGDLLIIGDRFKRYCALGGALATARAYKALAPDLHHGQLQAGAAEKCCQEAGRILGNCSAAADGDSGWRTLVQEEAADVERKRLVVEKDRLYVYCQPLPGTTPPLPDSKVLVSPVPYTLERVTHTQAELAMS